MALLNFNPTSCDLRMNIEGEPDKTEGLVLCGGIERDVDSDHVELSNGEFLEKIDGFFTLVDGASDQSREDKTVGYLYYREEEESKKGFYSLEVNIPSRQFDAIQESVMQGRLPRTISIVVDEMSFDFPGHSTWDTRTNSKLAIRSVSVSIPIIGDDKRGFFGNGNPKKSRRKARS